MIVIAFFFLLRPGEYTVGTDNTPFRLQDIQLRIGDQRLSWHSATEHQLLCVTFTTLEFTTQSRPLQWNETDSETVVSFDRILYTTKPLRRSIIYTYKTS
jgi:hypothetical protein